MQQYSVNQQLIDTVLAWVKAGEIVIPEIQRPFAWDCTKVCDLIDSLYQGYPGGYLIAWKNPDVHLKDSSISEGKRILIDGKQRITVLTAAILGQYVINSTYARIKIKIAFHPVDEKFEEILKEREEAELSDAYWNASLLLSDFQARLPELVEFVRDVLSGKVTVDNETMEVRRDGIIRLRLPKGVEFYLTFVKGELFVDRDIEKVRAFRQNAGLAVLPAGNVVQSTLRLPVFRVLGLTMLGVGLAFLALPLTGVAVAATPLFIVGFAGLALLGAWFFANPSGFSWANIVTPRNVIMSSIVAGTTAFSAFLGSLMASAFIKLTGVANADPTNFAGRLAKGVLKGMAKLKLVPYQKTSARAAEVVEEILGVLSNFMVSGIFSGPFRVAMSANDVWRMKGSPEVFGHSFAQKAALVVQREYEKRERQHNGMSYTADMTRPIPGSFALVSNEAVVAMIGVLKDLGLTKFEDSTPVDFFIKPILDINEVHIAPAPVEGEIVLSSKPLVEELLFRVVIMDPLFVDQNGNNLMKTEVPAYYAAGVLNAFNPAMYYKLTDESERKTLFERAGKFASVFETNFSNAVIKWRERSAPQDVATMRACLQQGLLHEFTHALALSLPDKIPSTLPQNEQARLNQFSLTKYVQLLSSATELYTSVAYTKNIMKALRAVEKQQPSGYTQQYVLRLFALEMFCDRFGMYMFELSRKIGAYAAVVMKSDEKISLDAMRLMEKQRLNNPKGFQEINELSDEDMRILDSKLKEAENEHVLISAFGDPAILESERKIFEPFLDLLRHFDREKTINIFTKEHAQGGFFEVSKTNRVSNINRMSVENIVRQT